MSTYEVPSVKRALEGVALAPQPWAFRLWWLVPGIAVNIAQLVYGTGLPVDLRVVLATALGLAAGVVWQLGHRRDLVDRLWVLALMVVVATVVSAMPGIDAVDQPGSEPEMSAGGIYALAGVLAGLVLTEQWLRSRDKRRERKREFEIARSGNAAVSQS